MFDRFIKRLTGTEQKERHIQGFLNVSCASCGATEQYEITHDGNSFRLPEEAIDGARQHFNSMKGVGSVAIFIGRPQRFGGELHSHFMLTVTTQKGDTGSGYYLHPRALIYNENGSHQVTNEMDFKQ